MADKVMVIPSESDLVLTSVDRTAYQGDFVVDRTTGLLYQVTAVLAERGRRVLVASHYLTGQTRHLLPRTTAVIRPCHRRYIKAEQKAARRAMLSARAASARVPW